MSFSTKAQSGYCLSCTAMVGSTSQIAFHALPLCVTSWAGGRDRLLAKSFCRMMRYGNTGFMFLFLVTKCISDKLKTVRKSLYFSHLGHIPEYAEVLIMCLFLFCLSSR